MRIGRGFQIAGVAALCMLVAGGTSYETEAQSLSRIRSRISRTQERLRDVKEEQAEATTKLSQARNRAQQAQDRADEAERRLEEVRGVLREVKANIEQTEAELERHRKAMSERLVAMYETGEPSYLEVVLNATSFEDFTNRAEYARLMARQDEELLTTLVETEKKLADQRAELEIKAAQAEQLKQEADRQARIAAAAEAEAARLVGEIKKDREALEAEFAALRATEREIEAQLRRHASSGSGYSGTCTGNLLRPCPGRITSPFGYRTHPVWGGRRFHNGVDIAIGAGTTIRAADDGKVIHAGWKGAYGKTVMIDHGSGWVTMYGHCSKIYVSNGQTVSRGQAIAAVGSTGVSTGPHLHWTVYRNGSPVNPLR